MLTRRQFIKVLTVKLAGLILAACRAAPTLEPTTQPTATPPSVPTATPTITPTPSPTPIPIALNEQAEAMVDPVLFQAIRQSPYIQTQLHTMQVWVGYWTGAQAPVIIGEWAIQMVFDPTSLPSGADDPDLANKVNLLLMWHDLDGNPLRSYIPLDSLTNNYQETPPRPGKSYEVEEDARPLNLDEDEQGFMLVWRGSQWVRINLASGEVKERLSLDPPFGWEPATLWVLSSDISKVTDWDRKPLTKERMNELVVKTDGELLVVAPKVDPKLFYADRPEITSLTPAEVTRLDGGVTLLRYDTNVDRTVVTKIWKEPGLWWQVEAGTVGKDIKPELVDPLKQQFFRIQDHQAIFKGNTLVDAFTGSPMAKRDETGQWGETSVQERYGHLFVPGEQSFIQFGIEVQSGIRDLIVLCRSTGNMRWERGVELPEAGIADRIIGDLAFIDGNGKLQQFKNAEVKVITDDEMNKNGYCTVGTKVLETNGTVKLGGDSKQVAFDLYQEPGQQIYFMFSGNNRYAYPYIVGQWGSNADFIASKQAVKKDGPRLEQLISQLRNKEEVNIPDDLHIVALQTSFLLTPEEKEKLRKKD
jgi:hypothetical protein